MDSWQRFYYYFAFARSSEQVFNTNGDAKIVVFSITSHQCYFKMRLPKKAHRTGSELRLFLKLETSVCGQQCMDS